MANTHKGEVALPVNGRTYTLRCGNNALAELEDAIGLPIHQLWQRWSDGAVGVREIRAMLWAFAKEREKRFTLEDAGNLLDEAGTESVTAALLKAVKLAFPSSNGKESAADPQPAAGSGTSS